MGEYPGRKGHAGHGRFLKVIFLALTLAVGCFVAHLSAQPQAVIQQFVVAQDGTGDFASIQEAVNAVRDHSQARATIIVKNGVYREKLVIPSWKKNIHIKGQDRGKTVITNGDFSGEVFNTYTSYTVLVQADDCILENLTVQNTAGPVGQAVALHIEGDRCEVVDCDILGHQDTLYAAKGRQYYRNCLIEGTTDFIFGEATAVFSRCTVRSLRNSYITAASTAEHQAFGFVFLNCRLVAAEGMDRVFLGRPWRPFAQTVFIHCELGPHIAKAGWDPWKGDAFFPDKEKTVFYAEYGSWGEGASPETRVSWARQLADAEVWRYALDTVFAGWRPSAVVQRTDGLTGVRDTGFTPERELARLAEVYPQIRLARAGRAGTRVMRDVPYRHIEGTVLTADIYPAQGGGKEAPAVLLLFGGGWQSGNKAQLAPLAEGLAEAGYTAVAIDYRLSTHALYPAAVCDVKAALGWMRHRADSLSINPEKVAVLGFSAGGQLAALAGTTAGNPVFTEHCSEVGDDRVQAIIDIDGILAFVHPESGEGNDTKSTSSATRWFGYSKFERPDLWRQASALTYVSAETPPTLFVNSSVDRMHAGRDDFNRVLDSHGIYHETKVFADAPHAFCFFEPWFTPTLNAITGFLDRVL
ncbi:pectinesterase [Parapedobacter composti]|uniref:Pectinesterase n=1 Tax=Parapedobacter composti TaxID=623281 RepID=A0A1I1HWD9_9SPHI|nr:pectinesterase family protein [Parapedobacter composti]SFC28085.1 pectinesterase [Parapedobacter composti]